MMTNETAKTFTSVQSQPSWSANGPCQPPRKSTVVRAAITTMPTYSGQQEEREPQSGVLGHVTEDQPRKSAIGMSNGGRRDLGQAGHEEDQRGRRPARAATTASRPRRCRAGSACRPPSPRWPRPAPAAARTRAAVAAPRRPPSRLYLLAEAQADISTATTPTPRTARTKNRPTSKVWATRAAGSEGDGQQHQQVRKQGDHRGELEDTTVGAVGDDVLLLHELSRRRRPAWAQPW